MQSMKETAANMAASAKAGMVKIKAGGQEKVEKMSAHDPVQKEMATEKKEARIAQAELHKRDVHKHNAAARQAAEAGGRPEYTTGATYGTETHTHSATSTPAYPMGTHQMSAMPGQPHGGLAEEGVARTTHPSGFPVVATGHNNPHVEGVTQIGPGSNVPGYGLQASGERPRYGGRDPR